MRRLRLNVGSLLLQVSFDRSLYPETIAEIFCNVAKPAPANEAAPQAEIVFVEKSESTPPPMAVPQDGIVILETLTGKEIHTEALIAEALLREGAPRFIVTVRRPLLSEYDLKVHVTVVVFKLLFFLDRLALHAAGVRFQGRVHLFLGGKGAGKTTASVRLARSGGTVLGEDRLILRRSKGGFLVSGSGETFRVTEQTERHFFPVPLAAEPREVGGVLKKEVRLSSHFSAAPHTDFPVWRIFFNHVGERFAITPLSKHQALLELIRETKASHRFAGAEDYCTYLGFLREFVEAVPAYRLQLSKDLGDLERLDGFLSTGA
jgi:hypothetical protein